MKTQQKNFFWDRVKSMEYAVNGFFKIMSESSIKVQITVCIIMSIVGFWVGITRVEWMFQLLCFGLVLSVEGLNTAIEEICDFIHPDYHKQIGLIKDMSAGSVVFAVLFSVIVGVIIYTPYILALFD